MMKIVKAKEMARVEKLAFEQGVSEEECMQRAGEAVAQAVQYYVGQHHIKPPILLLCGSGNNAGDAYVAGRHLKEGGFDVSALALAPFDASSPLCQLQSHRFAQMGGEIRYIKNGSEISFAEGHLILDGVLGTGFHGEVQGLFREAIEKANRSKLPILSIDIPSGLDGTTGKVGGVAIQAKETLFLGLPKAGCFLGDAWNYVGRVRILDFGLEQKYIAQAKADFILIDEEMLAVLIPPIIRTRHKYEVGYVVGVGGSHGMPGAPLMASFSTLRAGAGMVRLLHPEGMESELSSARHEVIRQGYKEGDHNAILKAMERAAAVFIGPGMGTSSAALKMLRKLLPQISLPCVIDAEALTLIATHDLSLPPQTVLTPHHGEMKRLLKLTEEVPVEQFLKQTHEYSERHRVTVLLKGAPSFVFHPKEVPHLSAFGDPGMATAGSGDILTGIIAGLLAQMKDPLKATLLGAALHAKAGEYAAEKWTSYCLVAEDLLDFLPHAFRSCIPSTMPQTVSTPPQ